METSGLEQRKEMKRDGETKNTGNLWKPNNQMNTQEKIINATKSYLSLWGFALQRTALKAKAQWESASCTQMGSETRHHLAQEIEFVHQVLSGWLAMFVVEGVLSGWLAMFGIRVERGLSGWLAMFGILRDWTEGWSAWNSSLIACKDQV